jgi:hypothetical protein
MRSTDESSSSVNELPHRKVPMTRAVLRHVAIWLMAIVIAFASAAAAETPALRARSGGAVHAVVIGIDAYRNVRQLHGAAADARDLDQALRKMRVKDVVTLIDAQVDRTSVMREIDRMLQRTARGDLFVLTIAGHGAQEPERVKGSQPDGMDDIFLLPGFDTTPAGSQQRIIGSEFNHIIKQFEARGAQVLFVADTCHGGGMTREIDPRAVGLSFRQVPSYTIPVDDLKPIAAPSDAFMTELDFKNTTFLAAVDRKTKAPEVRIPGIESMRGALSYAVARAFEGQADVNHDGKVTPNELFTHIRQLVYQLSDQRQNPVTQSSPDRDIDTDVEFVLVPSAAEPEQPTAHQSPAISKLPIPIPVRIASRDGVKDRLGGLTPREVPFNVVTLAENPDLVWDPASGDLLAGGDVIAYGIARDDLPSAIDRTGAVKGFKQLAASTPQSIRTMPNDALHRKDSQVEIDVPDVAGRALILFNIAGDGTVQWLYPLESDSSVVALSDYRVPVQVREPFGADQVVAITSDHRMESLEQALKALDQRRSSSQVLDAVRRLAPTNARIGTTGLFTAP